MQDARNCRLNLVFTNTYYSFSFPSQRGLHASQKSPAPRPPRVSKHSPQAPTVPVTVLVA